MAGGVWLLDLTRTVSRAGRGPMTGVDRVEHAYLDELLRRDTPVYGLVRTALGFLILDRAGAGTVANIATGQLVPPRAGWPERLLHRSAPGRADAEALLRRQAAARAPGALLWRVLRRLAPAHGGLRYLNTGHANLSDGVFRAVHRVPGGRAAVLVHDVIPLDHPGLTRLGVPEAFARRIAAVSAGADLVIHTTRAGRHRDEAQLARFGRVPPGRVARLGLVAPRPAPQEIPADLDLSTPYFVVLGTIEPRKNHALLLDMWSGKDAPRARLLVLGGRGWRNEAVFARLDALNGSGRVVERRGLSDGAVAAILQRSRGLLFPSLAEGTGIPALEAAALGVPVVCSDLPELREVMRDYPVYLKPSDGYAWATKIKDLEQAGRQDLDRGAKFVLPTWEDHFKITLSPDW